MLQPEATGAVREVTNWLKPLGKASHELVAARVCRPQREWTPSKPRKGRCTGRPDYPFGEGWYRWTDEQGRAASGCAGV